MTPQEQEGFIPELEREPDEECWLILGLNQEAGTVVIAGFAKSKQLAAAKAAQRMMNSEYPYGASKIVKFADGMPGIIEAWLQQHGISANERGRIIRSIGREIERMMSQ